MTAHDEHAKERSTSSMAPSERHFSRVGSGAAFSGLVVYGVSAYLHPWTPPHHTHDAFSDYAAESGWALYHLGELLGILLMGAALLALTWRLRRGVAGVWATLGGAAMVVCAGVYAVFVAVDGVALGIMVDRWASAGPDQQALLYETAFAVRQIEGGLFSLQWFMFGVSAGLFAAAFLASAASPVRLDWFSGMGWLSVVASIGALSFGIVQAHGYTDLSMSFQTGLLPGVIWIVAVGIFLYRNPVHGTTINKDAQQTETRPEHEPAD